MRRDHGLPARGRYRPDHQPLLRHLYALVYKPGTGLDGAASLADPRLKDKRLGIVAGTPPSNAMLANGLMTRAKPYPLVIDTRVDSSARDMIRDIEDGTVDAGVLWGADGWLFRAAFRAQAGHRAARRPAHELQDWHGCAAFGSGVQAAPEPAHPGEPSGDRCAARKLRLPLLDAQNRPLASAGQKSPATATPRN